MSASASPDVARAPRLLVPRGTHTNPRKAGEASSTRGNPCRVGSSGGLPRPALASRLVIYMSVRRLPPLEFPLARDSTFVPKHDRRKLHEFISSTTIRSQADSPALVVAGALMMVLGPPRPRVHAKEECPARRKGQTSKPDAADLFNA